MVIVRALILCSALSASACSPSIDAVCHRVRAEGLFPQEHIGRQLTERETQALYMSALRSAAAHEGRLGTLDFRSLDTRSRRAFKSSYGDGSRSYRVAGLNKIGKVCGGGRDWDHCRCFSATESTEDLLAWLQYFK